MKIVIQGYWNAEVSSIGSHRKITPEEYLKTSPEIHICDIIIDGKIVGTVAWNGKELSICPFKIGTQHKKQREGRKKKHDVE